MVLVEATTCGKCGCADRVTRHGQKYCRHCGKLWVRRIERASEKETVEDGTEEPEVPGIVYYHVMKCPECKSGNTRTTSTQRPTRYHKCKECGHNFKSTER